MKKPQILNERNKGESESSTVRDPFSRFFLWWALTPLNDGIERAAVPLKRIAMTIQSSPDDGVFGPKGHRLCVFGRLQRHARAAVLSAQGIAEHGDGLCLVLFVVGTWGWE